MLDALNDPFVQSSLLPLLAGLVATGAMRLIGGVAHGDRLAPAGITLAALGVFVFVIGMPAFPPPSSLGRFAWSAAGGLLLGLFVDRFLDGKPRIGRLITALWFFAALAWIVGPAIASLRDAILLAAPLLTGFLICVGFLPKAPYGSSTAPAAATLSMGIAMGGVALIGGSAAVAQTSLALAAATGGFLLWNWPTERHFWGASGRVALALPALLAALATFYTAARVETLLVAPAALAAGVIAGRLPVPETRVRRGLRSAVVVVLALLVAVASVSAAYLFSGAGHDPYAA